MNEFISVNLDSLRKDFPEIEYVRLIKSGKEAEVHLVCEQDSLYALKLYKNFQKYSSQGQYLQLHEIGTGQTMRAIKNKSRAGRRLIADIWREREYNILRKLNKRDACVPEVFALTPNGYLMEYIGDVEAPAPRLVDVKLTNSEAERSLHQITSTLWDLLYLGYVHGDLSAYNVLHWQGETYVIDFPQVLSVFHNTDSQEKLSRDLERINDYFSQYGLRIDGDTIQQMQSLIVF